MKKRQAYAISGCLVGAGAPLGALILQYLFNHSGMSPISFVDAQWAAQPFFYWYMLLSTCVVLTVLGYYLGRFEDKEVAHLRWTQYSAQLDPVTGVVGPVQFQVLTRAVWESFPRQGFCLAGLVLQIDGLDEIDKKYGHAFGLGVLRDVAWLLHFSTRDGDLVTREEAKFVCLLPRCDGQEAASIVRRLQEKLQAQTFRHENEVVHLSVSAGISVMDSPLTGNPGALFKKAGENLSVSAKGGFGQTLSASMDPAPEVIPKNGMVKNVS